MKVQERFLRYLYSSRPLEPYDFRQFQENNGIFKQNFAESEFRKPLLEKMIGSIRISGGGVFLVSGYRGVGKTSFLNYVLDSLGRADPKGIIHDAFNVSSVNFELKFEILCRIVFVLHRHRRRFSGSTSRRISRLYGQILWERTKAWGITAGIASPKGEPTFGAYPSGGISASRGNTLKWKDNPFYLDSELQEILKIIKERENVKLVITLDELDKIPTTVRPDLSSAKSPGEPEELDWLLRILSDIKYFLFESGIVFVLVVNKNVFDHWKASHSDKDLFLNLVTSIFYLPSYFKEEMELNPDFQITVDEEIVSSTFSPYAVKHNFQTCLYYESYANPRIFFQLLSRRIRQQELRITRKDAEYLALKVRLHEFSELIYHYIYERKETHYRRLLAAVTELSEQVKLGFKSSAAGNENSFFGHYYRVLKSLKGKSEKGKEVPLSVLWDERKITEDDGDYFFDQLEAFITATRDSDRLDNYPAANYFIRRLTDFIKIIEERLVVSVAQAMAEMRFESYELRQSTGHHLIGLLIPLGVIVLRNNGVITVENGAIQFQYQSEENVSKYHQACRHEFYGDFKQALNLYNQYIDNELNSIYAMNRKLRMLLNMGLLLDKSQASALAYEWRDVLEKMEVYFRKADRGSYQILDLANYYAFFSYYNLTFASEKPRKSDQLSFKEPARPGGIIEHGEVENWYDRAMEEEPASALPHLYKGVYLFWQRRLPAALDEYQEALKLDEDPFTHIRKGECQLALGQADEAMRSLKMAYTRSSNVLQKMLILHHVEECRETDEKSSRGILKSDLQWISALGNELYEAMGSDRGKYPSDRMKTMVKRYGRQK